MRTLTCAGCEIFYLPVETLTPTTRETLQLQPAQNPKPCVYILGPARSGTSMVAGIVSSLGIPTHRSPGESPSEPSGFWGDPFFSVPIDHPHTMPSKKILQRYFLRDHRWGLKAHGFRRPQTLIWVLQNVPMFIIETKRPVKSIRQSLKRKRILERGNLDRDPIVARALTTMRRTREMLALNREVGQHPVFAVKTDALIERPRKYVPQIARFLGVDDEDRIEAAIKFVNPEFWHFSRRDRISSENSEKLLDSLS